MLVYLTFLSIGAEELFKTKWLAGKKILTSVFLGGVIIMQAPLLLWGLGEQVRPVDYPTDWYQADQSIMLESGNVHQVDGCQDTILFLPWHLYMSFGWIGRNVANPAASFFHCPLISGTNMEWGGIYDNSGDVRGQAVGEWVKKKGETTDDVLGRYNVRYIILAKEVDWRVYLWLDGLVGWQIAKDSQTLRIYERKSP